MGLARRVEQIESGGLRVTLTGSLDEEADVDSALASLTGQIVLDLGDIDRINSLGIHRWIPGITRLTADLPVVVERVPYPLGRQANCVANLFGRAEVRSCLAPYFCPRCQAARPVLVERAELAAGPPARSCPTCQGPLELDELDSFFAFLGAR